MTEHIERLRDAAEQKVGRRMHTPKDFDFLRDCIYGECHEMVSISTLKRLWGYNHYEGTPRVSSLNPIARYVGYRDWDDYLLKNAYKEKLDNPNESFPLIQQKTSRHLGIYALAVLVVLVIVIGCGLLLNRHPSSEQANTPTASDFFVPSGKRVLRKGQDCFRTIDDYLVLFGIEATDTAYFRPLPNCRYVYLWGPEYLHPVWHNEGDSAQLLPTITEYWTPLAGEKDYQNKEYIRLANEKLYYERLEKDELRLTFMKNLVDGFYVFIGIYCMDREQSSTEKTVWKRVSDECDMGNLNKIEQLRNN